MSGVFDVGIVGLGVAGSFAIHRLVKERKDLKIIGFDIGRPPQKRRGQVHGFLGLLPNSDGKLYQADLPKVAAIIGSRKTTSATKSFMDVLNHVCDPSIIKDRAPNTSVEKRLKKAGYLLQPNNYSQIFPKDIHALSKLMSNDFDVAKNVAFSFDNEILDITKQKGVFVIQSEEQEYRCRKLLLCIGRAGWRQASELFQQFGIVEDNNTARFGVRIEMPASNLKEFNRSNLTIYDERVEIGPFSWGGTVIPEDHIDLAISAFRSNEDRWKTDKVSFQFISKMTVENDGWQQTDRLGKLAFILANDRVSKERVSSLLNRRSEFSQHIAKIKEYEVVREELSRFGLVVPEIMTKAYCHLPTIIPLPPKINIGTNLETEVSGLYVAGECAGIVGLLAAAVSGLSAAKEISKELPNA